MATATLLDSKASSADGTSFASNSFTPGAGDLLVVGVVASGATASLTLTDSQSLRWTQVASQTYNSSGQIITFWVADNFAAASSMTVTYGTASATGATLFVWGISGMTRTGWQAVRQLTKSNPTFTLGTTPGPAFSYACDTANVVLGVLGNVTNPATIATGPTGFTESADTGYATPDTGGEAVQRNSGFTGTTVSWNSTSPTAGAVVLVELDTSAPVAEQTNASWETGSVGTVALRYKKSVGVGHVLVCYVAWNAAGTTTCTVADGVNGAWTAIGTPLRGSGGLASFSTQAFYLKNTASGRPTVTATFNANRTERGIVIAEAAASDIDGTAAVYSNYNGTHPVSTALTNTSPTAYLFAGAVFGSAFARVAAGGFTAEESTGFAGNAVLDRAVSSSASYQADFGTVSTDDVMTLLAAFGVAASTASPDAVATTAAVPIPVVSADNLPPKVPKVLQVVPNHASGVLDVISASFGVGVGNAIVAFVYWNDITQTCSVDDGVNTWAACGGPSAGAGALAGYRIQMFAALDVAAGATTVIATFSGFNTNRGIAIHEVTNLDSYHTATYANVTAVGNAFTSGSVDTTESGEFLLFGGLAQQDVATITAPFTIDASGVPFASNATADYVADAPGSYSCSGTTTSATNDVLATVVAAFAPSPGVLWRAPGRRTVLLQAAQRAASW